MCVHVWVRGLAYLLAHLYTCVKACVCVCVCLHVRCVCACVCTCVCTPACVCAYARITCVCACLCVFCETIVCASQDESYLTSLSLSLAACLSLQFIRRVRRLRWWRQGVLYHLIAKKGAPERGALSAHNTRTYIHTMIEAFA